MRVKVLAFLLVMMCVTSAFASPIPIVLIPLSTLRGTTTTTSTSTATGITTTTGTTGTTSTTSGFLKPTITINFGRRR